MTRLHATVRPFLLVCALDLMPFCSESGMLAMVVLGPIVSTSW